VRFEKAIFRKLTVRISVWLLAGRKPKLTRHSFTTFDGPVRMAVLLRRTVCSFRSCILYHLPARRYAGAISYATVRWLPVCLSVSRKQVLYWNGFRNGSSSFLTERQNSTYLLYIVLEGNSSIAGTRTVSSSTLSRTLNVEKFLHTRRPSQVSST